MIINFGTEQIDNTLFSHHFLAAMLRRYLDINFGTKRSTAVSPSDAKQ